MKCTGKEPSCIVVTFDYNEEEPSLSLMFSSWGLKCKKKRFHTGWNIADLKYDESDLSVSTVTNICRRHLFKLKWTAEGQKVYISHLVDYEPFFSAWHQNVCFLAALWKRPMSYRAAKPSSNTAARRCKAAVSRLPVNLSHNTCTTVDWRWLPLPKNSCTWRHHQTQVTNLHKIQEARVNQIYTEHFMEDTLNVLRSCVIKLTIALRKDPFV